MPSLNLRQIEVFRAVMITGSINGAAQLLYVSQPAVSRMLSHTEARIGFQLFERVKGRLYPSPEARSLFSDVESVYRDIQRVNTTLHNLVQQRHGVLRIASSPSLGHQLVPDAIAAFRRCNEDILVSLECLRHVLLRDRLLDQQADLGISLFPIDHPNLRAVPLSYIRVMVVCPADHPLTRVSANELPDALAETPFIGYAADTPFHSFMKQAFERVGLPYRPSIDVDSPHHACALVKNGTGFSVVDEISFRASGSERMAVLPILNEERLTISLVHLRREPLAQFAQVFVDNLRGTLEEGGFHLFNLD
ncbi:MULTISPECIES: LysR family transcriptional regulator [Lonsdalea]|uniref:LysR family transcriptional regulator n=2 Tax=Lonsdalea TaxID=1082702 RepID=A0ACD1J8P6_9GAMM|nr:MULTISPECIES: LysR substrate-binding domain-containing protein [Lonsdalea]OSM96285.1 LysR family transcriptional regulator [Lonsdalea populi]OSM96617.1 LysR family transcriptional regulator [Lonsdalea populi]QPQ23807.1 LysR family transcriptional regulator [Lonsdalea populi]RAT10810.1 LysR family transcriptional regulator [Lonsdalea quercina]RAT15886.1 LysR family transcriptional regulator [Lonsdalea quercina]